MTLAVHQAAGRKPRGREIAQDASVSFSTVSYAVRRAVDYGILREDRRFAEPCDTVPDLAAEAAIRGGTVASLLGDIQRDAGNNVTDTPAVRPPLRHTDFL